jgi:Mor family transcriptional regulator
MKQMTVDTYQEAHTVIGIMLCTLAKTKDMQVLHELQQNLSDRLAITPIKNLSDLYEVIVATVDAVITAKIEAPKNEANLTFGQMVDALKMGQIAKAELGGDTWYITKNEGQQLCNCNSVGACDGTLVQVRYSELSAKWQIINL